MYQIDTNLAAATLPAGTAAGVAGYFTDGDVIRGVPPTIVPAEWLNTVMLELMALVQAGGIAPAKGATGQAAASVAALIRGVRLDVQNGALVYAIDTGVANQCRVSYTPALTSVTDGMVLAFLAAFPNTGPASFQPNALPSRPLLGAAHLALQGGEITANGICFVAWRAALNAWVLLQCTGAAVQIAHGAATNHAITLQQLNDALAGLGAKIPGKSFLYYMANLT